MGRLPFRLSLTRSESACVVRFFGEIDYAACLRLEPRLARILDTSAGDILFDLDGVTLIDSEGIKMLLDAVEKARCRRRSAQIINCSHRASHVIELSGLGSLLSSNVFYGKKTFQRHC